MVQPATNRLVTEAAQTVALAGKADAAATTAALATKAPLNSPAFTGTPTLNGGPLTGGGGTTNASDLVSGTLADARLPVTSNAAAVAAKADAAATTASLALKANEANPVFTGTVTGVTKAHVGLGSVDNTADANKPISTATQTALDAKAPLVSPAFTGTPTGITKAHVGLGNVDNTSDAAKPVSTATATALAAKANTSSLAAVALSGAMSDIGGSMQLSQLAVGGVFCVTWSGTNWQYNGANITTRPTSRTDVVMIAVGGSAQPTFGLTNDIWIENLA